MSLACASRACATVISAFCLLACLKREQAVDYFTRTIFAWFLHVACELSKGNERMGKESQSFESGWSASRNTSSQLICDDHEQVLETDESPFELDESSDDESLYEKVEETKRENGDVHLKQ